MVERKHGFKSGMAQDGAIVSGSAATRCERDSIASDSTAFGQGQGRRERVPDMGLEGLGSLSLNTPVIIG